MLHLPWRLRHCWKCSCWRSCLVFAPFCWILGLETSLWCVWTNDAMFYICRHRDVLWLWLMRTGQNDVESIDILSPITNLPDVLSCEGLAHGHGRRCLIFFAWCRAIRGPQADFGCDGRSIVITRRARAWLPPLHNRLTAALRSIAVRVTVGTWFISPKVDKRFCILFWVFSLDRSMFGAPLAEYSTRRLVDTHDDEDFEQIFGVDGCESKPLRQ